MFKLLKLLFIIAIIGGGLLLYWFLPKYSFVRKNPGYCAKLADHLYYCGTQADLEKIFSSTVDKVIK